MTDNFPKAVQFVLDHEGGYSNDIGDPGGKTNYGISKRAYSDLDIKALTKEQAIEIYQRDYWGKAGCDSRPWPLDMILFDTAVNCGVRRATAWLKLASDPIGYLFVRLAYYASLKGSVLYMRGWVRRVCDLYWSTRR